MTNIADAKSLTPWPATPTLTGCRLSNLLYREPVRRKM